LAQAIDASVKGTVAGQASAAARFAEAQMRNVTNHINQLGNGLGLQSNHVAIGLVTPEWAQWDQLRPAMVAIANAFAPRDVEAMHSDSDMPKKASGYLKTNDVPQAASKTGIAVNPVATGLGVAEPYGPTYAFWAAGEVTYGRMTVGASNNEFHTDGVTLGVDYQLNPHAVVGAAMGYGNDHTDVDGLGTNIKGSQLALSAYGVYEPQQGWLVDGQLGYGDLAFDNQRYSALSGTLFSAQRKGNSAYVALGLSKPMAVNDFKMRPYVRVSYVETDLEAYSEGGDTNALAYQSARIFSSALVVGVSASYEFVQADGAKWTPNASVELRGNTDGSINQVISFVNTPANTATLSLANAPKEVQTLGLGIGYTRKNGVKVSLNWLGSVGSDAYQSSGIRADIVVPF